MRNRANDIQRAGLAGTAHAEAKRLEVGTVVFRCCTLIVVLFGLSTPAFGTIDTIKGSLTCFTGCNRSVVQLIAQDEEHSFEVVGRFVDTSTAVQITGDDVSVSYGTRKAGSNSSIIVKFVVRRDAAPGARTVRMRYAIETSGPDTFTVKVVPKGTISQIQYLRPLPFRPGGAATELVPATGLPLNERVILIVTGTKLTNVQVRSETTYQSVRVLPGATSTSCKVEIQFASSGQGPLLLFDAALSAQDMRSSNSSKFSYGGGTNRNIQYGGTQSTSTFIQPISGGGGGSTNLFVDVAPRANMLNIFRRLSNFAPFEINGLTMVRVDDQFCQGMLLNQSDAREITVPALQWGVSNVGTADINIAFASQLKSGSAVLATETITSLDPGQTRTFAFQRQNSRVRVRRFSDRQGCHASPDDTGFFFEDPPFTVEVNTNGALVEATANQSNNRRNY